MNLLRSCLLAWLGAAAGACAIEHRVAPDARAGDAADAPRDVVALDVPDDGPTDADLVDHADVAPDEGGTMDDVVCGVAGQRCCTGMACAAGTVCTGELCVPCGAVGQVCCGASCDAGATCNSGTCQACGANNAACCPDGSCSGGGACVGNVCRSNCGGAGQDCCSGNCGSGLACLDPGGRVPTTCMRCGDLGEPACAADPRCRAGDPTDQTTTLDYCTDESVALGTTGGGCTPSLQNCAGTDRCIADDDTPVDGRCVRCGEPGLPCCRRRDAVAELYCTTGRCDPGGNNADSVCRR